MSFRIYNRALSVTEITVSRIAGPDANLTYSMDATVVGDVDGDGRDDILYGNQGASVSISGATATNAVPILGTLSQTSSIVTISTAGPAMRPYALGDLNNDGYDDFALANREELRVFYGSANIASGMTPAFVIVGADLSATGGDFNGDGRQDMAVTGRLPGIASRQPHRKLSSIRIFLPFPTDRR